MSVVCVVSVSVSACLLRCRYHRRRLYYRRAHEIVKYKQKYIVSDTQMHKHEVEKTLE